MGKALKTTAESKVKKKVIKKLTPFEQELKKKI